MITIDEIRQARKRIAPFVTETPLIRMENLDELIGCKVYLKAECMQRTNSFKIRGAMNKLLSMSHADLQNGVVAASSGNHGKGVAFVAKQLGIRATIVIPDTAPKIKIDGIRSLGADVVQCKYEERHEVAGKLSRENGYAIIHPYDDKLIMAGQGTIGLEIMEQLPDVTCIAVPVGGGGLISGIAVAVKSISPAVKIIGLEAESVCCFAKSLAVGERLILKPQISLADAILTLQPGVETFPVVQAYVDKIITVPEEHIAQGSIELLTKGKVLAEFSSAIGIAAGLQGNLPVSENDKVCFVISGGNIDPEEIVKRMHDEKS